MPTENTFIDSVVSHRITNLQIKYERGVVNAYSLTTHSQGGCIMCNVNGEISSEQIPFGMIRKLIEWLTSRQINIGIEFCIYGAL